MKKTLLIASVLMVTICFNPIMADEWYDKIKLSGDFRNRFEYVRDNSELVGGDVVKRYRDRIRLRVAAKAEVIDDIDVGFRFATNDKSSPVSTNQTLDTGFSKKAITLDLAYAEYKASSDSVLFGLNAVIGKMKTPFFKPDGTDLLWDSDLTPEGAYVSYSHSIGKKFDVKWLMGGFWVEENSKAADSGMLALEIIGTFKPTDKLSFDLGISYFNYGNAKNNPPFYDSSSGFGNTTKPGTKISYKEDFDLLKVGLESEFNFDFAPIKFYADIVTNIAAKSNLDSGFLVGFSIGKIKGAKSWAFSYSYMQLKADATIGAFTGSGTSGGTDNNGSKISIEYAIHKNWLIGTSVFSGNKNINSTSDKFTKVQFDLEFKF